MHAHNAALWIDHHEARIFHVGPGAGADASVLAPRAHLHRHGDRTRDRRNPADAERYYHEVVRALQEVHEILVVGPSTAKLEFIKHVHRHDAKLTTKIVGVETVDHPTDAQLAAYARTYFEAREHDPAAPAAPASLR